MRGHRRHADREKPCGLSCGTLTNWRIIEGFEERSER